METVFLACPPHLRLYSRYENTEKSALYTYDVDVCFMAALAAKIGFPWIYEYVTGNNCENISHVNTNIRIIDCL